MMDDRQRHTLTIYIYIYIHIYYGCDFFSSIAYTHINGLRYIKTLALYLNLEADDLDALLEQIRTVFLRWCLMFPLHFFVIFLCPDMQMRRCADMPVFLFQPYHS
jgi:hypothetical protein